jgi:hypothetical protein
MTKSRISSRDLLGNQPISDKISYLQEIGDDEAAERLMACGGSGQALGSIFATDAWDHTGALIGFIAPAASGPMIDVVNASLLPPEPSLKGTRVKVSLERFWVHQYPGLGNHQILCEFLGKNQIAGDPEDLRFSITVQARDHSSAGVNGTPIFYGVSVGNNGIAFECSTVNVRSTTDDILLKALGSGPFRDGLSLLSTAQPALKPFVGLAENLTRTILSRSKNCPVYHFKLGLDFDGGSTSACLRHGSFVVVQGDEASWSWSDVVWNADSQQLLKRSDRSAIEFNYIVFRVSAYNDEPVANVKPVKAKA